MKWTGSYLPGEKDRPSLEAIDKATWGLLALAAVLMACALCYAK